ncbi:MAG TPA: hypothetical protein VFQ77_04510 [Pseudonocardiaceae bacterium]|jgi:hypothetical protein|nr:hypothetical protein [Pseudonocardiaceae bacterium]
MFTLGESATGAFVLGSFADLVPTHTPLAQSAQIRYRALRDDAATITSEMTVTWALRPI